MSTRGAFGRISLVILGATILVILLAGGLNCAISAAPDSDPAASDLAELQSVADSLITPLTDDADAVDTSSEPNVKVTEHDEAHIIFELVTDINKLTQTATPEGECVQLSAPAYHTIGEPGEPALPVFGTALGIPLAAQPSVRVINSESTVVAATAPLCPQPQPVLDEALLESDLREGASWAMVRKPEAYTRNAFSPDSPVEMTSIGFIRDQRVAILQVRPFQHNPVTGEIRVFTQIRIEVVYNEPETSYLEPSALSQPAQDDPYERYLQSQLLNYTEALAWRGWSARTSDSISTQSANVTQALLQAPTYRIETEQSGVHKLTFEELQAVDPGVDLSEIDPHTIHITNAGSEIAIDVATKDDTAFAPGDSIYFYAESINTKYSDTNVYWLFWDGTAGDRIASLNAAPTGAGTVPTYYVTIETFEEDHLYRAHRISADGDNWYWDRPIAYLVPVTGTYTFELSGLSSAPPIATLTTWLLGYQADPYHSIIVQLNDHSIYTNTWTAGTEHIFTTTVPSSYLQNGTNTIAIVVGVGNSDDRLYVNRFRLTYGKTYSTSSSVLQFDGDDPGTWEYHIGGFTTDTVKLLDITDLTHPTQIVSATTTQTGDTYTLAFAQTIESEHRYLAVAPAGIRSPKSIARDTPSDLRSSGQGADYIAITHADFRSAAQELAAYRGAQRLRTAVVDVQDIYDEFSHGIPDAEAIRSFLSYAYFNWTTPAPAYVVLFGDGHYDPKNNLNTDAPISFMPPYLADVDPWLRETAADNLYVCVDEDDNFPDMAIGRLPVTTVAEANALVAKIISYEQIPSENWMGELLFIADNTDDAGNFAQDLDRVVDNHLPQPYTAEKIYYDGDTDTVAATRSAIQAAINQGKLIVNYAGHGAYNRWATEKLFSVDAALPLTNTDRLPLMVPMTCWEGYFIRPDTADPALAETLLRLPTTGAIASWSATGLGLATGHDYLNRGLFDAIFKEDIIELGPATTYAKHSLYASGYYTDLLDTYTLFGDPATRLNVLPVDLQIEKQTPRQQTGFKAGNQITYTLTYTNAGPATAHHVTISDTLPAEILSPNWVSSGAVVGQQVGSAYIWDIADLPAGTGGVITITGRIDETYDGTLTNTAVITTTSKEGDGVNNTSEMIVEVAPSTTNVRIADLAIQTGPGRTPPFLPGDAITYTLTYENSGPDLALDVVLTNTLPLLVTGPAFSASGATASLREGSQYVWDIADLPAHTGGTITITGVISRSLYSGPITNTVTIESSTFEMFPDNNSDSVTVMISAHRVYLPLVVRTSAGR